MLMLSFILESYEKILNYVVSLALTLPLCTILNLKASHFMLFQSLNIFIQFVHKVKSFQIC